MTPCIWHSGKATMIVQKTEEWLPGIRGEQGLTTREHQEGVFQGVGTARILTGAYVKLYIWQSPENCMPQKGNLTLKREKKKLKKIWDSIFYFFPFHCGCWLSLVLEVCGFLCLHLALSCPVKGIQMCTMWHCYGTCISPQGTTMHQAHVRKTALHLS